MENEEGQTLRDLSLQTTENDETPRQQWGWGGIYIPAPETKGDPDWEMDEGDARRSEVRGRLHCHWENGGKF